jgi:ABC-type amino acid transport system permease subunit
MDLFDPVRWQATFASMDTFWEGFGFTLQVVVAALILALVLGTVLGIFSTTHIKASAAYTLSSIRTRRFRCRCSSCTPRDRWSCRA